MSITIMIWRIFTDTAIHMTMSIIMTIIMTMTITMIMYMQRSIVMIRNRRKRYIRRMELGMKRSTITIITNIADWEIFSRSLTGVR